MNLEIDGRTALVCGASQGLGLACATALAEEGVSVVLVARRAAALQAAADQVERIAGRRPRMVVADLGCEDGRQATLSACPAPDILVTNAGGPPGGDFRQLSVADWTASLSVNFLSAVELIRQTVDGMIARKFGRIVNITSMTVRMPVPQLDLSNASRLALTGYVAGVARQVAQHNVSINNLLPGTIATERIRQLGDTAAKLVEKVPAGRAGLPEEFAAACAFLCSRKAGFITGQNLLVDGGLCPITV